MRRNILTKRSIIVLSITILILAGGNFGQSVFAQTVFKIDIFGFEAEFPEVRANVRFIDDSGRVPADIEANMLDVYENGQRVEEFELVPAQSVPKLVAVYVDSGQFSTAARDYGVTEIRNAFTDLITDGYFEENKDLLILTERISHDGDEETLVHANPTSLGNDLTVGLGKIDFPVTDERTEGFKGLADTLDLISDAISADNIGQSALIFFVHNVNWPPQTQQLQLAQEISTRARNMGTQIYVVHANPKGEYPDPFEILTSNTGGAYINPAKGDDLSDRFEEIYLDIASQSQSFTVRFNSANIESGARDIAIVPAGVPLDRAEAIGSVDINLEEPSVLIESKPEIIRNPLSAESGGGFEPNFTPIQVRVESWPYQLTQGDLISAELLVDGFVVERLDAPDPTGLSFNFNVSEYVDPSTAEIQVRVNDKVGITGSSNRTQFIIDVLAPAAPVLVADPAPEPELIVEEIDCASKGRFGCFQENLVQWLPWILTGTMFLLLIWFGFFFYKKLAELDSGVAKQAFNQGGVREWTKTILGGQDFGKSVSATLKVIKGPSDLIGESVEIYSLKTTIGRNPSQCDILLYDQETSCSISGLHCTIQNDMGKFWITDSSNNGTKVNGEAIMRDSPAELPHGSEVLLGDLFRRGALLKFEIVDDAWQPEAQHQPAIRSVLQPGSPVSTESYFTMKQKVGNGIIDHEKTVLDFEQDESEIIDFNNRQLPSELIPELEEVDNDWQSKLS